MTDKTDRILEFLADTGAAHSKRGIEVNLDALGQNVSYSTIKRHLPKLEAIGLVEVVREKGPYYRITKDGRAYLAGELDVSDRNPADEE